MEGLYLITNRKLITSGNLFSVVENAVKGGVDNIILREKDLSYDELLNTAEKIKKTTSKNKVSLIINGNINVAKKVNAEGFHTSFEKFINEKYEYDGLIGVSIHSIEQAVQAQKKGADYILASHVYKTQCKKGLEPKGIKFIKEIKSKVSIPVISLGGINEKNLSELLSTGTDGIAVMSYIMASSNPYDAAKTLKKIMKK